MLENIGSRLPCLNARQENIQSTSKFARLPADIHNIILSNVSVKDGLQLRTVCKSLCKIYSQDNFLWKFLVQKYFPDSCETKAMCDFIKEKVGKAPSKFLREWIYVYQLVVRELLGYSNQN